MKMHRFQTQPLAPTGGGILFPYTVASVTENNTVKSITQSHTELEYFRSAARAFFVRSVAAFLFGTAILCAGAFIAATTPKDKLLCLLGTSINLIACYHYVEMCRIRERLSIWQLEQWARVGSINEKDQVNIFKSSVEEYYVDSLRFSDWFVRVPSQAIFTSHPTPPVLTCVPQDGVLR